MCKFVTSTLNSNSTQTVFQTNQLQYNFIEISTTSENLCTDILRKDKQWSEKAQKRYELK